VSKKREASGGPGEYQGLLANPWVVSDHEELAVEFKKHLRALFDHHHVDRSDPHAWQRLAVALAVAHVPAFQQRDPARPRPGSPIKWNVIRYFQLTSDVRSLLPELESVEKACNRLLPKYRQLEGDERWEDIEVETPMRRYHEGMRVIEGFVREAAEELDREGG
jgi:hypothetical protein